MRSNSDFKCSPRLVIALVVLLLSATCSSALVPHANSRAPSQCIGFCEPRQLNYKFPRSSIHQRFGAASSREFASDDVFILSFDGVVAETASWRAQQGLNAALATWPHLSADKNNHEWLLNKMMALAHVVKERPGTSLSCEYALLARLLLEEQELDQGRSVGRTGKYASKYHPQQEQRPTKPENTHGSRPLTVGEVAANWHDGGCLSDSLLARYNIERRNPLPILQETIEQGLEQETSFTPKMNSVIEEALLGCTGHVYVTVGHDCDFPIASSTLEKAGLEVDIVETINKDSRPSTPGTITLVSTQTNELKTIENIMAAHNDFANVFVVNSSWRFLQKAKRLFGDDDMPRIGMHTTDRQVSLNFPMWADNTHPTLHNQAEMDPWTQVMTEHDLGEMLSARLVRQ